MLKPHRIENLDEINYIRNQRDGYCLWGLFKRDGCSAGLDAHHIIFKGAGGDDDRKNLITLCRKHHQEAQERKISADDLSAILTRLFGYQY
jgi:5-methylcytosine-specific restriction endonuclease McrA